MDTLSSKEEIQFFLSAISKSLSAALSQLDRVVQHFPSSIIQRPYLDDLRQMQSFHEDLSKGRIQYVNKYDNTWPDPFAQWWRESKDNQLSSNDDAGEVVHMLILNARNNIRELNKALQIIKQYSDGLSSNLLFTATLQYAIILKQIQHLDDVDGSSLCVYECVLPSARGVVDFIVACSDADYSLCHQLVSRLCYQIGNISVLSLMERDNSGNDAKTQENIIYGLGDKQVTVAERVLAWSCSLDDFIAHLNIIQDITAKLVKVERDLWIIDPEYLKDMVSELLEPFESDIDEKGHYSPYDNTRVYEVLKKNKALFSIEEWQLLNDVYKGTELIEPPFVENDDYRDHFPGLKNEFKNLSLLYQIVDVVIDEGLVKSDDRELLLYRLSGQAVDRSLLPLKKKIVWASRESGKNGKSKGEVRHPNELYYLLNHMFKGTEVENSGKTLVFFVFDEAILPAVESVLNMKKMGSYAQSAPYSFQKRLNEISPLFTLKSKIKE